MVKTLRCSSCGAGLKFEPGQPNVVCEYCKSFVRIGNDAAQYDSGGIIKSIAQIWPRVRNDNFTSEYEKIKDLISNYKYLEANKRLDVILEKDKKQARAWFYKSLMPIIDQENILFRGCYVNIIKVSQITNRKVLHMYLKNCGMTLFKRNKFLAFYRSTDFLFEQNMNHLEKAIENASTPERLAFFKEYKKERIKLQRRMLNLRKLGTIGLILLLVAVIVGGGLIIWHLGKGYFNG